MLGTWLEDLREPAVIVALARSGIDYVLIDSEHGSYSLETIEDLCLSCARDRAMRDSAGAGSQSVVDCSRT